ncbi:splicing factor U2AF 26 kDa subunit isoform X2 [Phacochoerus africanus]|uniref:splicing factor U2AF 26 kDa subunit isoform X2 n=1 Tax=Phacochoerus africanus TaxID=41426 RepID=UPI001FD96BCF|nr:splicing factor U2AF 26 kDa subunit isoform X2 [Phacochoerus africanus]
MAEYLASIFGTEKDKSGPAGTGTGAPGFTTNRLSARPTLPPHFFLMGPLQVLLPTFRPFSRGPGHAPTIVLLNLYRNPQNTAQTADGSHCHVSDVEVQEHYDNFFEFRREEDAERAVAELNNRWFNGQAVHAELSPVTDFRESCCRQYEMGECTRGGFCNFMHLRPISRNLRRQLYGRGPRRRSPPRSHAGHRPRERNRRRSPDHRHGRF